MAVSSAVKVAVRVRPLLPSEILHNQQVCVRVGSGPGQLLVGQNRRFSFDFAFGPEVKQDELYEKCARPLVASLLEGYNVTVFTYGQTGSGKTYTMGGRSVDDSSEARSGIIPRAVHDIFQHISEAPSLEISVKVSYVEVYKEELKDLLELETPVKDMHIREDEKGNTVLVGAREFVVQSAEELLCLLESGNALRHTGCTHANQRSSRSHAIFTITISQGPAHNSQAPAHNSQCPAHRATLNSKFNLVDLAGSERVSRTGNRGQSFQECVQINSGLLALGNVIRALSGRSQHIPYRSSKVTRLLRNALGGNAQTLLITCVSPSSHSLCETLSSLNFSCRAQTVHNQPLVNWDTHTHTHLELDTNTQAQTHPETDNLHRLTESAARLLGDMRNVCVSLTMKQRLQAWLDTHQRLLSHQTHRTALTEACWESEGKEPEPEHITIIQLRRELNKCQEVLLHDEQIFCQKESELRELKELLVSLDQENKLRHLALMHERNNARLQCEKLEEQQLLIDRLRGDLLTCRTCAHKTHTSHTSDTRPYSVPLSHLLHRDSQHQQVEEKRKIHTSPPAYSLERVLAAFRTRSQLLQAQIEQTDKVVSTVDTEESQTEDEKDEHRFFRRSMNRTWTRRHNTTGERVLPSLWTPIQHTEECESVAECGSNYTTSLRGDKPCIRELLKFREQSRLKANVCRDQECVQELQMKLELQKTAIADQINHHKDRALQDPEQQLKLEHERRWLEQMEEKILQQRQTLAELEVELKQREEIINDHQIFSQEKSQLEMKKLRSSQVLSKDLLRVSTRLAVVEQQMEEKHGHLQINSVELQSLRQERELLCERRKSLEIKLQDGHVLTAEEEHVLFQLDEGLEVLDAAIEYKNHVISSTKKLLAGHNQTLFSTEQSIMGKLSSLSYQELQALLLKYFNKVVCLREVERRLTLRCEELELQAREQQGVVRELEAGIQRVAMETERRLTEQHQEQQKSMQQFLQEVQKRQNEITACQQEVRIKQMEKELFFYKATSRELKKKLKDVAGASYQHKHSPEGEELITEMIPEDSIEVSQKSLSSGV